MSLLERIQQTKFEAYDAEMLELAREAISVARTRAERNRRNSAVCKWCFLVIGVCMDIIAGENLSRNRDWLQELLASM